jgi:hypothetical protein
MTILFHRDDTPSAFGYNFEVPLAVMTHHSSLAPLFRLLDEEELEEAHSCSLFVGP